ncbi:MAG: sulfotransferase family 2 domain-containing protein [Candidatus Electrothrix sp. Rat3]|nr:sulfotransferase family 2 domain-containing protein [Candidatus Electrothrix rattekaaiensis]
MKPLRFMHIPKTAGTTFTCILKRQYFRKKSFHFIGDITSDIEKFKSLSKSDRENVVLFTGHESFMTGINRIDTATTITFLRDPVSRVKSFCQHVSEGKSPNLINDFPPESFNLDAFLESGNGELSNLQTKMLINYGRCAPPLLLENMSASEAKDLALDNLLNKISLFGLQEYFDESLIVFLLALNWRMPLYSSRNKKNPRKLIQFEKHHVKRIAELNSTDMEVYRLAKKRFKGLLESEAFDKKKLKRFHHINARSSFA